MCVCLDQLFAFLEPVGELWGELRWGTEGVEVGECTRVGSNVGRIGGREEGHLKEDVSGMSVSPGEGWTDSPSPGKPHRHPWPLLLRSLSLA